MAPPQNTLFRGGAIFNFVRVVLFSFDRRRHHTTKGPGTETQKSGEETKMSSKL